MTAEYITGRPVLERLTLHLTGPGLIRIDDPNGRGKSTFIEVTSGYLRPTTGTCRIDGLAAHDPRARAVRRVCRSTPALHPNLSLRDHLALAADLAGNPREESYARASALGLDEWMPVRTSDLSTGTARKLWYLMCTTGPFRIALLDEPFNAVDVESTVTMVTELTKWSRDRLIILVCHTIPGPLHFAAQYSLSHFTAPTLPRPTP